MTNLINYLSKQSKSELIVLGFLLVILVGIFDHLTGPELFFSIFYLFPIYLVTWLTERRSGVIISVASAATWLITDFTSGAHYSHPSIPYWNMSVRLATFLIITYLISELKKRLESEKELARTDSLTGIANRRSFFELARLEINRARRYKHPFTILHIDLDNFKTVNDRFGHDTGDKLLCLVANTIQNIIRATDRIARLGGDEFVVLLPEAGPKQAKVIAQKVQQSNRNTMKKNNWPVTLSIGVASFVFPPSTVDELLKLSDHLLYTAKKRGKNKIKYQVFGRGKQFRKGRTKGFLTTKHSRNFQKVYLSGNHRFFKIQSFPLIKYSIYLMLSMGLFHYI